MAESKTIVWVSKDIQDAADALAKAVEDCERPFMRATSTEAMAEMNGRMVPLRAALAEYRKTRGTAPAPILSDLGT